MTKNRYKLANPNNLFKDMNIGIVEDNTRMLKLIDVVELLNNLSNENEQLKKDRFICLDCKYCGYTEIGCLCEKQDHWEEFKNECNDFKELKY